MVSPLFRLTRTAQGRTLDDVAVRARVERSQLSRFERGLVRLPPPAVRRIMRVLRITPEAFVVGPRAQ